MIIHEQEVVIRVRVNPDNNTIEIDQVLSGASPAQLNTVSADPPTATTRDEMFWEVLRIGNRRIVLCEIDAIDS